MTDPTTGERVRWRQGSRWRHGHLHGAPSPDGLTVRDTTNGAIHTLAVGAVEHETRGSRGGVRWQPFTPPEAVPAKKPRRRKGGRQQLTGQMDLFEVGP
jgi:hypothetical protein